MARARGAGNGRHDETLATLMQLQANLMQHQTALMQQQAAFLARASEIDARVAANNARIAENTARMTEMDRINSERFARIEAMLIEHNRILQALTDAIRDKIGFKAP